MRRTNGYIVFKYLSTNQLGNTVGCAGLSWCYICDPPVPPPFSIQQLKELMKRFFYDDVTVCLLLGSFLYGQTSKDDNPKGFLWVRICKHF
jgi:hypothetical protein